MLIRNRNFRRQMMGVLLTGFCALALLMSARAGWPPRIEFIERFLGTNVLIHFDTEPNFAYALQYTETLTNGVPGPFWTNLYVAPKLPFVNHYIVPDTGMRTQRFYRLHVYR